MQRQVEREGEEEEGGRGSVIDFWGCLYSAFVTPSNNAILESSNIASYCEVHNIQLDLVLACEQWGIFQPPPLQTKAT